MFHMRNAALKPLYVELEVWASVPPSGNSKHQHLPYSHVILILYI